MTDPFDGLRSHGRRVPPELAPVEMAGARRRRRAVAWGSGGVAAAAVAGALVLSQGGVPATSGHDVLVGSDPTTSAEPTAEPTPTPAPTPLPLHALSVQLSFATGTADGLYGIEHVGDTGASGFHVVRIDPTTLAVQRSALIPGAEGGLAVDNRAVYVTAVDSPSVLRFAPSDLAPLGSWRDPLAKLTGPVVATRNGLWVADAHGLTRLVGDGQAGGDSTERSPGRITLAAGYSTPDLLADDFWAVALDGKDCPTLYRASGTNGLEGTRTPAFTPDCSLGFTAVVATPTGVMVSTPTGSLGYVSLVTQQSGTWHAAEGPRGPNSIEPSVAGKALFAAVPGELMCLGTDAHALATVPVHGDGIAQVIRAGGRDLLVVSGSSDGGTVEPFTPDPACG